jgi:hypothetical protein
MWSYQHLTLVVEYAMQLAWFPEQIITGHVQEQYECQKTLEFQKCMGKTLEIPSWMFGILQTVNHHLVLNLTQIKYTSHSSNGIFSICAIVIKTIRLNVHFSSSTTRTLAMAIVLWTTRSYILVHSVICRWCIYIWSSTWFSVYYLIWPITLKIRRTLICNSDWQINPFSCITFTISAKTILYCKMYGDNGWISMCI